MRARPVFALLFLGLVSNLALGQTAGMLSFQGLIKDAGGNPINGTVDLEFRIFDAETFGNLVDMNGDDVFDDVTIVLGVTVTDGILSTKFGPVHPKAFDGTERWLEVSVDGSPLSRIEMATAPAVAERLNRPGTATPAIAVDDATGNVTIPGTIQAGSSITIDGTAGTITGTGPLFIEGTEPDPSASTCCSDHAPASGCDDATCEAAVCGPDPFCCGAVGGTWDGICATAAVTLCPTVCGPTPPVVLQAGVGRVGIGTTAPAAKLDVAGNIKASGTIQSGSSIIIDGTTDTISSSSGTISFDDENLTTTGLIESTVAGFKFPDGTLQTTAATGGGGTVARNPAQIAQLRWYEANESGATFSVGNFPNGVAFDGANIWVASFTSDTVTKLRAGDGALLGTFSVGNSPRGVAFDGANIWVANSASNNVTKLRASDGAWLGTFSVGSGPVGVAFDGANIWVTNNSSANVTKLRAGDGALLGTFSVGSSPFGVAFDGANIWVTNYLSHTVSKL